MNSTEFGKENLIRRRYEVAQNGSMIFLIKMPKNTTVKLLFWHGDNNVDAILISKEIAGNGGMFHLSGLFLGSWPTKQVLFYGIEYTLLEMHKSIAGLVFKLNNYVYSISPLKLHVNMHF